jgi:hypothetical protein
MNSAEPPNRTTKNPLASGSVDAFASLERHTNRQLRNWAANIWVLTIVIVSFCAGSAAAGVAIILLRTRLHWSFLAGENQKMVLQLSGVVFGLLPAYLAMEFIDSRRRSRAGLRGFQVGSWSDNAHPEVKDEGEITEHGVHQ